MSEVFSLDEGPPPEGLQVKVVPKVGGMSGATSVARVDGNTVGTIWTRKIGNDLTVIRADVDEEFKGRQVGRAMYDALYDYAKEEGLGFRSDTELSPDAVKFWTSLVQKGLAKQENGPDGRFYRRVK